MQIPIFSQTTNKQTGEEVIVGQVRDGDEEGNQTRFQSATNKVSSNWDSFVVVMAFDGRRKNITSYNVTTIEKETGRVVLHPRMVVFSNPNPIFSFDLPSDEPLLHNKTYFTRIEGSACSCCGIVESMSSIGFLVDTTPPEIGSVEVDTEMLGVNGTLTIQWENISDPESQISNIEMAIVDSTTNISLPQQCGGSPSLRSLSSSSGQLTLTWTECGGFLPPVTPLKIAITSTNGAGLTTTMLSRTSFQVAGVRITNLISWDSSISTGLFSFPYSMILIQHFL